MSDQWQFHLKPSLLKLIIYVVVIILMASLAAQILAIQWVALGFIILVVTSIITRERQPLIAFSQLDAKLWTVARQSRDTTTAKSTSKTSIARHEPSIDYLELSDVKAWGILCWLTFVDTQHVQFCTFCVIRDQLSVAQWRKLMQLNYFFK